MLFTAGVWVVDVIVSTTIAGVPDNPVAFPVHELEVDALPEHELEVDAFPDNAPMKVVA